MTLSLVLEEEHARIICTHYCVWKINSHRIINRILGVCAKTDTQSDFQHFATDRIVVMQAAAAHFHFHV
jgi:hypothetical protein